MTRKTDLGHVGRVVNEKYCDLHVSFVATAHCANTSVCSGGLRRRQINMLGEDGGRTVALRPVASQTGVGKDRATSLSKYAFFFFFP